MGMDAHRTHEGAALMDAAMPKNGPAIVPVSKANNNRLRKLLGQALHPAQKP
jgi:hypothetical protein